MPIYLVGLMGSGKTSVGRALAERLGARFVDADEAIGETAEKSIARIFEEDGEPAFRVLEELTVDRLSRERPGDTVIALGGGAVLSAATRRRLRESGRTVWLRAPVAELAHRTLAEPEDAPEKGEDEAVHAREERPLLAGLDGAGRERKLAELEAARAPLYDEVADLTVETGDRSVDEIASDLVAAVAMPPIPVETAAGRPYEVWVERGGLGHLGRRLRRAGFEPGPVGLVADGNVARLGHVKRAVEALRKAGFEPRAHVELPGGEDAKTFSWIASLCEVFAGARLERTTPIVGIGGGALLDAAGFAAAAYLRGVPFVAVPTTLLAQVDAAIGGKTGVNLAAGKNLAGAFHAPSLVVADTDILATLPPREMLSALAEVLKYAFIARPERGLLVLAEARLPKVIAAFAAPGPEAPKTLRLASTGVCPSKLPNVDARTLIDLVGRCVREKADVVAADERESGPRKVLNFGHTIGHGIEAAAGFGRIAHGEAVALGMHGALYISRAKGLLAAEDHERLDRLLRRLPVPPLPADVTDDAILEAMARDKKVRDGKLLFVLLRAPGDPEIDIEVERDEVLAALAHVRTIGAQKPA